MYLDDDPIERNEPRFGRSVNLNFDIDSRYPQDADPAEIFIDLTRELQQYYDIRRGVLILKEAGGTRYVATALVSDSLERKNLSLRLPIESSLIRRAAEDGSVYTENVIELFSGNNFEKNLLIDAQTEAFLLYPIKHDGEVVGVIGYNSDNTDAFITFDTDILEEIAQQLGNRVACHRPSHTR